MPIGHNDLLDSILNETYQRLSLERFDDSWWRALLSQIQHEYVTPDFLNVPHLQEWLRRTSVKSDLLQVARAALLGTGVDTQTYDRLAETYSAVTLEAPRLAAGPIEVVTSILAAGLLAGLDSSDLAATAIVSAGIADLKTDIADVKTIATAKQGVSVISEVAKDRLLVILKRRGAATERSFDELRALAKQVSDGDLAAADRHTRAEILYWAARLHVTKADLIPQGRAYLNAALAEDPQLDVRIPRALLLEAQGDFSGAIRELRDGKTADDRSALFAVLARAKGDKEALSWFDEQPGNTTLEFATPLGWRVITIKLFFAGRHEESLAALKQAQELSERLPDLALLGGVLNAAMLLPKEHREHAAQMNIFHPAIRVQEGPESDKYRSAARESFNRAVHLLDSIDLKEQADVARESLLWLRLTDPDSSVCSEVRNEIRAAMSEPLRAVELIRLAHHFEIQFDASPLKQHLSARARWGGLAGKELVAELLLSEIEMSPLERAEFIARDELRLSKEISVAALVTMLVDAYIDAGQCQHARTILQTRQGDIETADRGRLLAKLVAREGGDPRTTLEESYEKSKKLLDLHNLSNHLWSVRDWVALQPLLKELFERERTGENAQKLVACMQRNGRSSDSAVMAFLTDNDDLVEKSDMLISAKAWAYFGMGQPKAARELNDRLLAKRRNRADLMLDMNLAIQMGDWERFAPIVDRDWKSRNELDPEVLMQLATLASEADTSVDRALELGAIAASKAPSDPHILLGAYALGFQLGREDKVKTEWLRRAVELSSGGGGPVWQVDMKTVIEEMVPAHRERARKIEEDVLRGAIPLQAAAKALNTPIARVLIDIPKQNAELHDGRQRTLLPIVCGGRSVTEIEGAWKIALDITSIMVLWSLGILKTTIDALGQVVLSPDIMVVLLNERRRVLFHQPSLVVQAEEIRELIDQGLFKTTSTSADAPPSIVSEVGRDLAELLALAKAKGGRVVRPMPVFKLSSFMQQPAELHEYQGYLLSCTQLVQALFEDGLVDRESHLRAQGYLAAHEKSSADAVDRSVLSGPLYLDDLALTYLRSAGVLRRIAKSGLDLHVHYTTREEKGEIARAYRQGTDLAEALNNIRVILHDALERGKATLLQSSGATREEDIGGRLSEIFPVLSRLMDDTDGCDAIAIDDGGFNRHISITDRRGKAARIVCLPDLVNFLCKTGALGADEVRAITYRARRAGFTLLPIEKAELDKQLRMARVDGDELVETDELRVLRQMIMRVRTLGALTQPLETGFLDSLRVACVLEIRELWSDESISPARAAALSTWIWSNLSPSPFQWAHTIREQSQVMAPEDAFIRYIAMLLQPMLLVKGGRYKDFIEWCNEMVVGPLALANGGVLDRIAEMIATNLEKIASELAGA